jgi:hypothetical protein
MATIEDAQAVRGVVSDAVQLLDWCASSNARLGIDDGEDIPVMPGELLESYAAAVEQLREVQVAVALQTLDGENSSFPMDRLLALLAQAGWDGPLRDFKLQVLEQNGRSEVREITRGGRTGGGRIRRAVFGRFTGALNAALDSLRFVPGVAAIKEVKDFVEKSRPPG